jgi:hypothetical protein
MMMIDISCTLMTTPTRIIVASTTKPTLLLPAQLSLVAFASAFVVVVAVVPVVPAATTPRCTQVHLATALDELVENHGHDDEKEQQGQGAFRQFTKGQEGFDDGKETGHHTTFSLGHIPAHVLVEIE